MEKIFAAIITIGDELLIGQVIDTNSPWMAQELNKIGVAVKHRVAVGDAWDDIWSVLDEESKLANIILITGGLGPTADDITKPLLCQYFNGKMIVDEVTLAHVTHIFANVLKRPMIERNAKQAEVPDVCRVLKNDVGTAPCMVFERDGKLFVAMPGVPHEMKWLMINRVLPLIASTFTTPFIEHRTLLTAGIGESFLAELIKDFEEALPSTIKLAYLPNYGMVRLRLTSSGFNKDQLVQTINYQFELLKNNVKDYLVIDKDISLQAAVGNLLKQHCKTMATAESCTGGYIAHLITSMAGSSAYFTGSLVSYDNRIKTELLGVSSEILHTVGAVSEQTVTLMANNVIKLMDTDYSIAVSGIMGPGGATDEKAVGLVWVAVADKEKVIAKQFNFRFDRERNIQLTAINALNMLRMLIVDNHRITFII